MVLFWHHNSLTQWSRRQAKSELNPQNKGRRNHCTLVLNHTIEGNVCIYPIMLLIMMFSPAIWAGNKPATRQRSYLLIPPDNTWRTVFLMVQPEWHWPQRGKTTRISSGTFHTKSINGATAATRAALLPSVWSASLSACQSNLGGLFRLQSSRLALCLMLVPRCQTSIIITGDTF